MYAGILTDPVTPGGWYVNPTELGPYSTGGAPAGTATVSMVARIRLFDPAVSTATGDLWLGALNPLASVTPQIVQPGQTATIPVAVTPTAPVGTVVHGTVFVDDAQLNSNQGATPDANQVAALRYSYTVGR